MSKINISKRYMFISKLEFTNINSGFLLTDIYFSLSVNFIISRIFFTDNEGKYLLILPTNIGYYSKKKSAKSKGFRGIFSNCSVTNNRECVNRGRPVRLYTVPYTGLYGEPGKARAYR